MDSKTGLESRSVMDVEAGQASHGPMTSLVI